MLYRRCKNNSDCITVKYLLKLIDRFRWKLLIVKLCDILYIMVSASGIFFPEKLVLSSSDLMTFLNFCHFALNS